MSLLLLILVRGSQRFTLMQCVCVMVHVVCDQAEGSS